MNRSAGDPEAVLLMGATCSGKSALALALAREFPIEIVSVDSAQVYRGMNVGTAKPSAAERAAVPHHLIDICDPADPYSAGRFRRDALAAIGAIRARGRIPLLVGGTMLYFRALLRGLAPLPEADPAVRARIDARARLEGWPALHAALTVADPASAARIRATDAQRIQRALEVHELTGEPLSTLQRRTAGTTLALAAYALATDDRTGLYRRIDARFDAMMAAGLLAEVRALRARGDLDAELPALRAVGYRQLWAYLDGRIDLVTAVTAAKRATRNLAKRQLTWLKAERGVEAIPGLENRELGPIKASLRGAFPDGWP